MARGKAETSGEGEGGGVMARRLLREGEAYGDWRIVHAERERLLVVRQRNGGIELWLEDRNTFLALEPSEWAALVRVVESMREEL